MLEAAGIPERYADCSFDNFTVYDNGYLEAAIRRARQFAVDFPVVKKGLLFIGRPGVGKTHLAVATLARGNGGIKPAGRVRGHAAAAGIATARVRAGRVPTARSLRRRKTDATIVGEPTTKGLDVDHIPPLCA